MKYLKTLKQFASEFITKTKVDISRGVRHTVRLHGPSGIGKTAIVKQLVERLAEETGEPWGFKTINIANHGAWDLLGVPDIVEIEGTRKTTFAPPDFLPDLSVEGTPAHGVFFIDEIDKAEGDMVNALMPLLYEGKVSSNYILPEGWIIVSAQNRLVDSSGSTASANVANTRRAIDVGIYADANDLADYAASSNWNPLIAAFLSFRPDLVHEYPNGIDAKKAKTITAFACPATWEMTNDFLQYGYSHDVLQGYLSDGVLGEAVATEFCKFLKVVKELPNWSDICKGARPEVSDVSIKYALTSSLAHQAINGHYPKAWANCISYCHEVLGPEFGVIFVRLATAKYPELEDTQEYRDYKTTNQDLFINNQ
tara:strand:+ start:1507 stop:2610 length:1104 start_codon:yes stop_codon:yes gene_type:complete